MKVKVLTDFRPGQWNIGDTVELFDQELYVHLRCGNVEALEGMGGEPLQVKTKKPLKTKVGKK